MSRCRACDKPIEDINADETLELCNKCFSVSMKYVDELVTMMKPTEGNDFTLPDSYTDEDEEC